MDLYLQLLRGGDSRSGQPSHEAGAKRSEELRGVERTLEHLVQVGRGSS